LANGSRFSNAEMGIFAGVFTPFDTISKILIWLGFYIKNGI